MQAAMCLGHCCNARDLQLLSKQLHCVCLREENAEAILGPPLHRKNQVYRRINQGLEGNRTKIGRPKMNDIEYNTVVPL